MNSKKYIKFDSNLLNTKTVQEKEKEIVEEDLKLNEHKDTEAFYSERYGWSLRKININ